MSLFVTFSTLKINSHLIGTRLQDVEANQEYVEVVFAISKKKKKVQRGPKVMSPITKK